MLEKRLNQHADDTILVRIFVSAGAAGNAAIQVAAGTHMDAGAEGKPIQLSLNIGNVAVGIEFLRVIAEYVRVSVCSVKIKDQQVVWRDVPRSDG